MHLQNQTIDTASPVDVDALIDDQDFCRLIGLLEGEGTFVAAPPSGREIRTTIKGAPALSLMRAIYPYTGRLREDNLERASRAKGRDARIAPLR